mmetsp:Transcript_45348/g.140249  ORF Transcript_45348/g.140249 Transcript_45348/m.140249 type:complete len:222 (+) Transcript_45348:769-1434(+)
MPSTRRVSSSSPCVCCFSQTRSRSRASCASNTTRISATRAHTASRSRRYFSRLGPWRRSFSRCLAWASWAILRVFLFVSSSRPPFRPSGTMTSAWPTSNRYGPQRPPSPAVPVPPLPPAAWLPPMCCRPSHSPWLGPSSRSSGGFMPSGFSGEKPSTPVSTWSSSCSVMSPCSLGTTSSFPDGSAAKPCRAKTSSSCRRLAGSPRSKAKTSPRVRSGPSRG